MADHDDLIDATLRDVPLPAGVGRRLAPERLFADEAIDRLLARVELPVGLGDRVRAAARAAPPARAPGPVDLERIAATVGRPAPPAARSARWLALLGRDAARVAVALAVVCGVFLAGRQWSRSLETPAVTTTATPVGSAPPRATAQQRRVPPEPPPAAVQRPVAPPTPPASSVAAATAAPAFRPRTPATPEPLAVRGAALGLPGDAAAAGAILAVEMPQDARRAVPRLPGYDLGFEMAHGEQPFVDPAAAGLAVDRPPLTLRTDTFDLLRHGDAARQPPRFRVEHLLAALPTAVRPGGGPRLEVRGVRARRPGDDGPRLLVEVLAAAPARVAGDRPRLDATVVLDRGPSAHPLAWAWVCQGLAAVAADLEPEDRVSVVLAGPVPRRVVSHANAAALAKVAAELTSLSPSPAADLEAALALAAEDRGRIVIVTQAAAADAAPGRVRDALATWRARLAGAATAPADVPRFVLVDAPLPGAAAGIQGGTPAEPAAIRRALVAQVFDAETVVARNCRLEVAFAPAAVASYRLVGHRQSAVESLASDPADAIDLHVGEAVRAVYEVVPRVALTALPADAIVATLSWREPATAADRTLRTALDRSAADLGTGLPSPRGCELLLAVGAGELAGGSAHLPQRGAASAALANLLARWRARGDVTPFAADVAALLLEPARGSDR